MPFSKNHLSALSISFLFTLKSLPYLLSTILISLSLFSILPIYIIYENLSKNLVMSYVAMGVSIVNLILTICLCARDLGDAIVRKFHV